MFVPTKTTVKLANGNTGNAQVFGIILCHFPNFSILYPVGPVYYFPGHLSNTISSGALKFYAGFLKVASELLQHCDFFDHQGRSWMSSFQTQNKLDFIQIKIIKFNPRRDRNIVVPTICALSKINLSQLIHHSFWSCFYC